MLGFHHRDFKIQMVRLERTGLAGPWGLPGHYPVAGSGGIDRGQDNPTWPPGNGAYFRPVSPLPWPVPNFFKWALADQPHRAAPENFHRFPPSCQRAYLGWLSTAKQPVARKGVKRGQR